MVWSVEITGNIGVDGDEGTIYLPPEVFTYMKDHKFSLICVQHGADETRSISVYSEHYKEHVTVHRRG